MKPELLSHLGGDFIGGDFDLSEIAGALSEHKEGKEEIEEEEAEEA